MSLSLKFYIAIITIISGALICALLFFGEKIDPWWIILIWGVSGWFADAYPVEVRKINGNKMVIGLGMTFNLSAAILFSPISAMIISMIAGLPFVPFKNEWYKSVFNIAQISIATFLTAFTYRMFPINSVIVRIFAIAISIGVYAIINNMFVAGAVSLAAKKRFGGILKDILIDFFGVSIFVSLAISYLAIYLYPYVHFYVIFVILGPLLAVRFVIDLYRRFLNTKLEAMYALTRALEEKDPYTAGHGERVSLYCEIVADKLGIHGKHLDNLKIAAQLHDVGKIGVRDIVLNKPERLTDVEYDEIKRHPVDGARIMSEIPSLEKIVPWIRYHHERWDGTGYPDGIKGEEIPLEARIIGICDVYDALTTKRSYRDEFNHKEAMKMITNENGKAFDPKLVEIFVNNDLEFDKVRVDHAPDYSWVLK